jgi:hypothetical protein
MSKIIATKQANQMMGEIRSILPAAQIIGRGEGQLADDGSVIPVGHRTVQLILRDARHGNTVVVSVEAGDSAQSVVLRAKQELSARAKDVRRRIALERECS